MRVKKYILLGVTMLVLTGCGKSVSCTINSENNSTNQIKVKFKKDAVSSAKSKMEFKSKDDAKILCNTLKTYNENVEKEKQIKFKCDENILTIDNYINMLEENILNMTKEEYLDYMQKEGYTCK